MKRFGMLLAGVTVFSVGYGLGQMNLSASVPLHAVPQERTVEDISNDTMISYQKFRKASADLLASLQGESLNVSATEGPNFFALSVGGVDALRDLEEGRGVDPETFAAIYADRISTEVRANLDTDSEGRIRYKGTIIRMYSKERLNEAFDRRRQVEARAARVGG